MQKKGLNLFDPMAKMMDPRVVRQHLASLKRRRPAGGEVWMWQCTVSHVSKVSPDRAARLKAAGEPVWLKEGSE